MYTCEEGTELTLAVESVSNKSGPAGAHEATLRVRAVRVFIAPAMVNLTFVDICTHKPVELLTDDTLSIADDAGRSTIFSCMQLSRFRTAQFQSKTGIREVERNTRTSQKSLPV